jgi:hypothetical protein
MNGYKPPPPTYVPPIIGYFPQGQDPNKGKGDEKRTILRWVLVGVAIGTLGVSVTLLAIGAFQKPTVEVTQQDAPDLEQDTRTQPSPPIQETPDSLKTIQKEKNDKASEKILEETKKAAMIKRLGHNTKGGIKLKGLRRVYTRTALEIIQAYAPLLPPGGGPPLPILTPREKSRTSIEVCDYSFEFCIGTRGSIAAGFSCGPAASTLEFSGEGAISLSASGNDIGQTIFVAGPFAGAQTKSSIVNKAVMASPEADSIDYDTTLTLHPDAFIAKFNEHYNTKTCPITTIDFCVSQTDPSMGFTIECDGKSMSVKLDGKLAISVSGNDGTHPMIEIGSER